MRLSVVTLRQVVKRDSPIAFVPQPLTSYGGLELLRRYLWRIELPRRPLAACTGLGGDYSGARLGLLLLALLDVGPAGFNWLRRFSKRLCGRWSNSTKSSTAVSHLPSGPT